LLERQVLLAAKEKLAAPSDQRTLPNLPVLRLLAVAPSASSLAFMRSSIFMWSIKGPWQAPQAAETGPPTIFVTSCLDLRKDSLAMHQRRRLRLGILLLTIPFVWVVTVAPLAAQNPPAGKDSAAVVRLTLDEARERILANNKLLQLAALNVQSKGYAARAAQALYFPQIIGNTIYFHFNDDLGTVLTTQGRHVVGPRGRPLGTIPSFAINLPVVNQDTTLTTIAAVQPITDLLKVRQGVKIARADEQIAAAQRDKGTRELLSGVEQLYWGLLVAQRIRAGAATAVAGTEELARTGNLEARTALVEGKQALQEVSNQIADLQEQLAILLEVPTCTQFELVEPSLPAAPVTCADEAVSLALATSPDIHEAEQTIAKARAAVSAAKLDYVPSIAVTGGYLNQTLADYIQPNIGYIGVIGSYTFVDWGKRKYTIRERNELVAMATLKLRQTEDTLRQNALKAFREYEQSQQALKLAGELVPLRADAEKAAATAPAKFKAGKDAMTAQVDYLKADLAYRIAHVKLMSLIGKL
jgi:outer membrane protein TolC